METLKGFPNLPAMVRARAKLGGKGEGEARGWAGRAVQRAEGLATRL
jgi:hypothetical protein